MIRMLIDRLLFVLLVCIAWLAIAEHFNPTPPPLLVRADYQQCVTIRNAPLLRGPQGKADFRLGVPFNDKGIS